MDQEVPLPPPRSIRHRSPGKAQARDQAFRQPKKLSRLSQTSFPSSDPAFFSSDDIPSSSLENYHGQQHQQPEPSRKRRYCGTWWGEMAKEAKRKRADFREKRNLDSGVWMGSDESSSDCLLSSEASSCEDFMARAWSGQKQDLEQDNPVIAEITQSQNHQNAKPFFAARNLRGVDEAPEHRDARAMINECLEKGQENVDLSNFRLKTIPTDLLRPLLHLTKQPAVTDGPVTDEVFTSLTPFLRLYLPGNSLTELQSEVFELDNLNVLSLRNNKLREIPGAIRKLIRLQEINLSMNRLASLPWEMLWLIRKGDLKQMTVHPNPFMSFEEAEPDIEQWHYGDRPSSGSPFALRLRDYEGPAPEDAWAPIHVAISHMKRFDSEGNVLSGTKSHYHTSPHSIVAQSHENNSNNSPSKVPSLRELALLECTRAPYLDQFLAAHGDNNVVDLLPAPVIQLLRRALTVRNVGGSTCSVCHRNYVIARTEWIEWWDCTTYENGLKNPRPSGAELRPLPFLRRGCSLKCVP